jgi:hypothetical protein
MEGAKSSTVVDENDPIKLPAVLLSDCWALIAAEKSRYVLRASYIES